MKKGRIGLHLRAQNKAWNEGQNRIVHGMKSDSVVKGSKESWKAVFCQKNAQE
jgi:hypothetical protein